MGLVDLEIWLGVPHLVEQLMSYWLLPDIGIPISFTTVHQITYLGKKNSDFDKRMEMFYRIPKAKLNSKYSNITNYVSDKDPTSVLDIVLE